MCRSSMPHNKTMLENEEPKDNSEMYMVMTYIGL